MPEDVTKIIFETELNAFAFGGVTECADGAGTYS